MRFVAADLSGLAGVRQLAADAGAVDILVNNASVMTFSPTTGQDLASYDAAFAVNVRAPFLLTALLAEKMAAGGGGSIVNVSSTAAGLGMPGMALYGATKAALESLTRTWAAEFAESNVRVNAVAPGPMRTSKVVEEQNNGSSYGKARTDHRGDERHRPGNGPRVPRRGSDCRHHRPLAGKAGRGGPATGRPAADYRQ
ncbi:SDR family NAD(P)-dependent oxidoreductase [Streptomyces flaveolus]